MINKERKMKKLIISLALSLVLFACTLLFNKTNIMGWANNPYAIFGATIGQIISSYLIAMLGIFLVKKMENKDQQRLLIAIFLVLYAFLWKTSFIRDAKHQCLRVVEEVVTEIQNNNQNL